MSSPPFRGSSGTKLGSPSSPKPNTSASRDLHYNKKSPSTYSPHVGTSKSTANSSSPSQNQMSLESSRGPRSSSQSMISSATSELQKLKSMISASEQQRHSLNLSQLSTPQKRSSSISSPDKASVSEISRYVSSTALDLPTSDSILSSPMTYMKLFRVSNISKPEETLISPSGYSRISSSSDHTPQPELFKSSPSVDAHISKMFDSISAATEPVRMETVDNVTKPRIDAPNAFDPPSGSEKVDATIPSSNPTLNSVESPLIHLTPLELKQKIKESVSFAVADAFRAARQEADRDMRRKVLELEEEKTRAVREVEFHAQSAIADLKLQLEQSTNALRRGSVDSHMSSRSPRNGVSARTSKESVIDSSGGFSPKSPTSTDQIEAFSLYGGASVSQTPSGHANVSETEKSGGPCSPGIDELMNLVVSSGVILSPATRASMDQTSAGMYSALLGTSVDTKMSSNSLSQGTSTLTSSEDSTEHVRTVSVSRVGPGAATAPVTPPRQAPLPTMDPDLSSHSHGLSPDSSQNLRNSDAESTGKNMNAHLDTSNEGVADLLDRVRLLEAQLDSSRAEVEFLRKSQSSVLLPIGADSMPSQSVPTNLDTLSTSIGQVVSEFCTALDFGRQASTSLSNKGSKSNSNSSGLSILLQPPDVMFSSFVTSSATDARNFPGESAEFSEALVSDRIRVQVRRALDAQPAVMFGSFNRGDEDVIASNDSSNRNITDTSKSLQPLSAVLENLESSLRTALHTTSNSTTDSFIEAVCVPVRSHIPMYLREFAGAISQVVWTQAAAAIKAAVAAGVTEAVLAAENARRQRTRFDEQMQLLQLHERSLTQARKREASLRESGNLLCESLETLAALQLLSHSSSGPDSDVQVAIERVRRWGETLNSLVNTSPSTPSVAAPKKEKGSDKETIEASAVRDSMPDMKKVKANDNEGSKVGLKDTARVSESSSVPPPVPPHSNPAGSSSASEGEHDPPDFMDVPMRLRATIASFAMEDLRTLLKRAGLECSDSDSEETMRLRLLRAVGKGSAMIAGKTATSKPISSSSSVNVNLNMNADLKREGASVGVMKGNTTREAGGGVIYDGVEFVRSVSEPASHSSSSTDLYTRIEERLIREKYETEKKASERLQELAAFEEMSARQEQDRQEAEKVVKERLKHRSWPILSAASAGGSGAHSANVSDWRFLPEMLLRLETVITSFSPSSSSPTSKNLQIFQHHPAAVNALPEKLKFNSIVEAFAISPTVLALQPEQRAREFARVSRDVVKKTYNTALKHLHPDKLPAAMPPLLRRQAEIVSSDLVLAYKAWSEDNGKYSFAGIPSSGNAATASTGSTSSSFSKFQEFMRAKYNAAGPSAAATAAANAYHSDQSAAAADAAHKTYFQSQNQKFRAGVPHAGTNSSGFRRGTGAYNGSAPFSVSSAAAAAANVSGAGASGGHSFVFDGKGVAAKSSTGRSSSYNPLGRSKK